MTSFDLPSWEVINKIKSEFLQNVQILEFLEFDEDHWKKKRHKISVIGLEFLRHRNRFLARISCCQLVPPKIKSVFAG